MAGEASCLGTQGLSTAVYQEVRLYSDSLLHIKGLQECLFERLWVYFPLTRHVLQIDHLRGSSWAN